MPIPNEPALDELRILNEQLSNALDADDQDDIREFAELLTQALRVALGPAGAPPSEQSGN